MTSWYENMFYLIEALCGIGWILSHGVSDAEFGCFLLLLLLLASPSCWTNSRFAGDLGHINAHVTSVYCHVIISPARQNISASPYGPLYVSQ